jgi:uncharacterized repeat protein (TIGR03803 family)
MRERRKISIATTALCVMLLVLTSLTISQAASQKRTLHTFNGKNGNQPLSGVISDSAGNLYGTTYWGPLGGAVFELTPGAKGGWIGKLLHVFDDNDGNLPYSGVVMDGAGNLYGTTNTGGLSCQCGDVFELIPGTGGHWTEKVLHYFQNTGDGYGPLGGLLLDASGNLYGTTEGYGVGTYANGNVFKLSPGANGHWKETVLYDFKNPPDGTNPFGTLIADSAGNLYGTTRWGGTGGCFNPTGCGTVFELSPSGNGHWTEKVLHSFDNNGQDGLAPETGLVLDASGNLYGTTAGGGVGNNGWGSVFELTPEGKGQWTEKILYTFTDGPDGSYPSGPLIFDKAGNLYGVAGNGGTGCNNGCGVVFELMPDGHGQWTEKVLYTFLTPTDGDVPIGPLILDNSGNLFGTTYAGGRRRDGTVFELTP